MDVRKQSLVSAYAHELVNSSEKKGTLQGLLQEIREILSIFNQQNLAAFLGDARIDQSEKITLLQTFQARGSEELVNFFNQINMNGDYDLVYSSLAEAIYYSQELMGEYDLTVTTVVPLIDAQKLKLIEKTERLLGLRVRQVIELIEPAIVGGFVLEINHKIIDASIRHQLQQVKNEMK